MLRLYPCAIRPSTHELPLNILGKFRFASRRPYMIVFFSGFKSSLMYKSGLLVLQEAMNGFFYSGLLNLTRMERPVVEGFPIRKAASISVLGTIVRSLV